NHRFYQFHLVADGSRLLVVPGLLEGLAYGPLFNGGLNTQLGDEFRAFFISQVATLSIADSNGFFNHIPDQYLVAENDPEGNLADGDVRIAFFEGMTSPAGRAFSNAISTETIRAGSLLPPFVIVDRSWTLNCDGCHGVSPAIMVVPVGVP